MFDVRSNLAQVSGKQIACAQTHKYWISYPKMTLHMHQVSAQMHSILSLKWITVLTGKKKKDKTLLKSCENC